MLHNAANVYSLYIDLLDFTRLTQNENRLVQAVHADLNVIQFIAGSRASVKGQRAIYCERMFKIRETRLQALKEKQDRQKQKDIQGVSKNNRLL